MSDVLHQEDTFDHLVFDGGSDPGDVGSLPSMAALFEALGSFLHAGDTTHRLEGEVVIESVVLTQEPRIVMRVPTTARPETGQLLASVGRCIVAANGGEDVRLGRQEIAVCATLAALLSITGWERLRIASVEDDWDRDVLVVPKELQPDLATLGKAHLKRAGDRH